MVEQAAKLPRNEIAFIAFDRQGSVAVKTLVDTASGMMRFDDSFWTKSESTSQVLTELENAVEILRHRCDLLVEREYSV